MITMYRTQPETKGLTSFESEDISQAVWIDMLSPTKIEDEKLEQQLGISIPTREDMKDIEPSELLWSENDARYLTARVLCRAEGQEPVLSGVTFILKEKTLVTVRYDEPRAFAMFKNRACQKGLIQASPEVILGGLIEAIIDRAADVMQMVGDKIDLVSHSIFEQKSDPSKRNSEYQAVLQALGRSGDLVSKQRESLVSIERILLFLSASYRTSRVPIELREDIRSTLRDLQSLEEHATFQSGKIQFLLDATLGLVNLEQNNIIKLFSVMAVVFMPPTLIASIYGMNFHYMPELSWNYGYPFAVFFMLLAAIVPYFLFRWKKWL